MPNIAAVLKSEIARIARKQTKAETQALRSAVASYRGEIARLKQRIAALERQGKQTGRTRQQPPAHSGEEPTNLRFSASRLARQREKLGLSAADFAVLLGVSSLSVYKWEKGQARPRAAQLQAIAAARGLGKREALERLEVLKAAK